MTGLDLPCSPGHGPPRVDHRQVDLGPLGDAVEQARSVRRRLGRDDGDTDCLGVRRAAETGQHGLGLAAAGAGASPTASARAGSVERERRPQRQRAPDDAGASLAPRRGGHPYHRPRRGCSYDAKARATTRSR